MNLLILGCNGMAGHTISLYMQEKGYRVTGFAQEESRHTNVIVGDARDQALLKDIIQDGEFDAVINCIGILNQYAEQNKALAVYLNAYLPHFLADVTKDMMTKVIHMSTDCVFSGQSGHYTEDALRDGETFYDRSKALGALEDGKNVILRNSIIGADTNPNGIGLLNWFMQQQGNINGYTKAMWTGQTTLQLAKTMEAAILQDAIGLYNAVPESAISKYDLLCLMNKYLRNDSVQIHPIEGVAADKSLVRTRFEFSYVIPSYETMMNELAVWLRSHKKMYPHYKVYEPEAK